MLNLLETPLTNGIPLIDWLRREAPEKELLKALAMAEAPLTRHVLCHMVRKRHIVRAARTLIAYLADPSPLVCTAAAWALGALGEKKAGRALLNSFQFEADPKIRVTYAIALGEIEYRPAVPALIEALRSAEPQLRKYAASSLAGIGIQRAVDAVRQAQQNEKDENVLKHMRWALARWKRRRRKAAQRDEGK